MMMKTSCMGIAVFFTVLLLAACSSAITATPVAVVRTATLTMVASATPTLTPTATQTATPTETPEPTNTPTQTVPPTNTPTPTPTRTPTPDPADFYLDHWIFPLDAEIVGINYFDLARDEFTGESTEESDGQVLNHLCESNLEWRSVGNNILIGQVDNHGGIDFYLAEGTEIYSPVRGEIIVEFDRVRIYIENDVFQTHFAIAHMTPLSSLANGQMVETGQLVGHVGRTSVSPQSLGSIDNAYEVHFDIRQRIDGTLYVYDPLWGPCSTSDGNPWGHTIIKEWDAINPVN